MQKILVVEDEMAYSKLLSSQLTKNGYQVIVAENGEQGLEKAKNEKPDLILLDIKMPVMDGLGMLNLLRKEEFGKKTKVIMLTNIDPDPKVIGEMVADRPVYYFVKSDINFKSLLDKISEVLK